MADNHLWRNELDFSDWLAENIEVLNEQVVWEIDATTVHRERSVWKRSRRVDLHCQATKPSSKEPFTVIIENQFGKTDNNHLARLMEYIAAFDAKGVVWIAEDAEYGDAQVMRWLNDNARIDAYLFKIDRQGEPKLAPVVYPGMPIPTENIDHAPKHIRTPARASKGKTARKGTNSPRTKARMWFERVLPKVTAECEPYGVWQTQIAKELRPWDTKKVRFALKQPVLHSDIRVSEYISWYVEAIPDYARIGIFIPHAPGDKSRYYYNALKAHQAEFNAAFQNSFSEEYKKEFIVELYWGTTRNGWKHILWDIYLDGLAGYESDDEELLELEANAVAYEMEALVYATTAAIENLTPYEEHISKR